MTRTPAAPPSGWENVLDGVQTAGLYIQWALAAENGQPDADRRELAADLARSLHELSGLSAVGDDPPGDAEGEWTAETAPTLLRRVAAAYHAWPHYAAVYYGWPTAGREYSPERAEARKVLCAIERRLYGDLQHTLDYLREAFGLISLDGLADYLDTDRGPHRNKWRPPELTGTKPDLCAVDALGCEIARVICGRPRLRRALRHLHKATVTSTLTKITDQDAEDVRSAFTTAGAGQVSIFFTDVRFESSDHERDEGYALKELLYEAPVDVRKTLQKLIPFQRPDGNGGWVDDTNPAHPTRGPADLFRLLVHALNTNPGSRPGFVKHRQMTLNRLDDTKIVSGATTSRLFLEHYPDRVFNHKADGFDPVWFNRRLDTPATWPATPDEIEDWENVEWWWTRLNSWDEFRDRLFPALPGGPAEFDIHANHHASVFWDQLTSAAAGGNLPTDWPALLERIGGIIQTGSARTIDGQETIGPYGELILRHEGEVRTTFFFATGQTHPPARPDRPEPPAGKLTQFVGGTFIGLERPGIPFEEERFLRLADHLRPLVLALAHFCTSWVIRETRRKIAEVNRSFPTRLARVIDLLAALPPQFERDGCLLFQSVPEGGTATDKDHDPQNGLYPSRVQINQMFSPLRWSSFDFATRPTPDSVLSTVQNDDPAMYADQTLKALLHLTSYFRRITDYTQNPKDNIRSDRAVVCAETLIDVFHFLLTGNRENPLVTVVTQDQQTKANLHCRRLVDGGGDIELEVTIPRSSQYVIAGSTPSLYLPTKPGIRFVICVCEFISFLHLRGLARIAEDSDKGTRVSKVAVKPGRLEIHFSTPAKAVKYFADEYLRGVKPHSEYRTSPRVRDALYRLMRFEPIEVTPTPEQACDCNWLEWHELLKAPLTQTPTAEFSDTCFCFSWPTAE